MRTICVITTSRADYSILIPVLRSISTEDGFQLQIIVSGTHLSPEYGLTYKTIEADGFQITAKVEAQMSSDSAVGVAKSMGIATMGFAEAYERLEPDLIMVLGDRYEILAAVQAALVARIPVAHIAGGDKTEGAFDDSVRHAITKMSHIHFATNSQSAERILQLGENPALVFTVGSPAIDCIRAQKLLSRSELADQLKFVFKKQNFIITFHPATLDRDDPALQFAQVLKALETYHGDTGIVFTKPNADPRGRRIASMIDEYVSSHSNTRAYDSLGPTRYYSLLSQIDVVIGNSSSGIYEAPFFKKPTVDIGNRQKGRLAPRSVIHCDPVAADIVVSINRALNMDVKSIVNPYGDGTSAAKIVSILKGIGDFKVLTQKVFVDIPVESIGISAAKRDPV